MDTWTHWASGGPHTYRSQGPQPPSLTRDLGGLPAGVYVYVYECVSSNLPSPQLLPPSKAREIARWSNSVLHALSWEPAWPPVSGHKSPHLILPSLRVGMFQHVAGYFGGFSCVCVCVCTCIHMCMHADFVQFVPPLSRTLCSLHNNRNTPRYSVGGDQEHFLAIKL